MTNDEKIAVFAGYKVVEHCPCGENCSSVEDKDGFIQYTPDYTTNDSDAITLLSLLVNTYGYYVKLEADDWFDRRFWRFDISDGKGMHIKATNHLTIASAICIAVLELIELKRQNEL